MRKHYRAIRFYPTQFALHASIVSVGNDEFDWNRNWFAENSLFCFQIKMSGWTNAVAVFKKNWFGVCADWAALSKREVVWSALTPGFSAQTWRVPDHLSIFSFPILHLTDFACTLLISSYCTLSLQLVFLAYEKWTGKLKNRQILINFMLNQLKGKEQKSFCTSFYLTQYSVAVKVSPIWWFVAFAHSLFYSL